MTVNSITDATPHVPRSWHEINWRQVYRDVRRLQVRIVKAVKAGKWREVKNLQRLLAHSFCGRCLAVRRVTENRGNRTPGVDNVLWDTPEKKMRAIYALRKQSYKAQPLRRIYIPKKNGKRRPLGIPTMFDRAQQALHLLVLDPVSETLADKNSYGFRPERSTADAIGQVFNVLRFRHSAQWILEGDIHACFDDIDHNWLLSNIPMDKTILRKWLRSGFMERNAFYRTLKGTPQGGICSPALANMTLDGLERIVTESGRKHEVKAHFIRYADDFIAISDSKQFLEKVLKPLLVNFFKERGLTLSEEKTLITHIDEGFDFLGQNIRKYGDKLLIKPSKKNVKSFLDKVAQVIRENKQIKTELLIKKLNPMIRGWANYHRHVVSKKTFSAVEHHICHLLWQWAKRRHPKKSATWIKKKYFKSIGNRNWQFAAEIQRGFLTLFNAASIPIRRHAKIKANANPYDPEWEVYFEERLTKKWTVNQKGTISKLWRRQYGICPACQQKIDGENGFHAHHIVSRKDGGNDALNNLLLLHPVCHQQVHAFGLNVSLSAKENEALKGLSRTSGNRYLRFLGGGTTAT